MLTLEAKRKPIQTPQNRTDPFGHGDDAYLERGLGLGTTNEWRRVRHAPQLNTQTDRKKPCGGLLKID